MARRKFGEISEIRSTVPGRPSRWRARYWGPDGNRHKAPHTFEFRGDAEGFLRTIEQEIYLGVWEAPRTAIAAAPESAAAAPVLTFDAYAEQCITRRQARARKPLRASTAALYRRLLRLELSPAFGSVPVDQITPAQVKAWHMESTARDTPTQTGNAYMFLRSVFADAIHEEIIAKNPCRVKGAGKPERAREVIALSAEELTAYVAAAPERYRLVLALAGWCGLRSGEVRALRVADYDRASGELSIAQAVSRIEREIVIHRPKTRAGVRTVYVPPHVRPMLVAWLQELPVRGPEALLFPAGDGVSPLDSSVLREAHLRAAEAIGRDGMTLHDLRR